VGLVLALILGLASLVSAIEGDLDGYGSVDWIDISIFTNRWLDTGCSADNWCDGADLDHSTNVDFNDFALLAQHWCEWELTDPNLVGWYKLDESSDTNAYDSSDYGYDGTLYGGVSWESTGGKIAGAARFDNDYEYDRVAIPTTGISRSKGTITLWARLEGNQTEHYRFFFGDRSGGSDDNRIQLYMEDDSVLSVGLADQHQLNTSVMTLSNDIWYHIALTWGGGAGNTYVVYVDGQQKATGAHNNIGVLTAFADIGNSGEPNPWGEFHGLIDEVGIWDRVLDSTEITDVFNNGIGEQVRAWNPSPGNGITGVDIDADLTWTAGEGATSHDVHFGTSSPPPFIKNQPGTTYDPGTMNYETTYHWRIDEKGAGGTATGNVWSFTTQAEPVPPGPASSPNPTNGAPDVSIIADLSWTAGSGATSHDVYFGTDSSPDSGEFKGNQTGTTYDPGTMDVATTYYWRIEEEAPGGTPTGAIWSFMTEAAPSPPGPASTPIPSDTATGVSVTADLSWTAGSDTTSHDVYFGTDSSPDAGEFKDNQTATTYDPGTMEVSTTYYWRIDEVGPGGTTTGGVWSFTTAAAGPTPAFPTAEGAGKWTIGGRGGQVYEVTNLNDSGTGSLRAAIEASGPRIVVFRVSGTITLESLLELTEPYITIAGQTAPGDGICLRDYEFRIAADQVIVRHLRCRVGDEVIPADDPNCPDSLSVTDGHNIIIDHCSASWSVDETLSVSLSYQFPYSPTLGEVTVQWCIISESLHDSVHVKGPHGCGSLIKSGWDNNYTFHHNLYAHHDKRLPSVGNYNDYLDDPDGWTIDFRNNVVYNWDDDYAGYYDADDNGVVKKNFIANYYIQGPQSDNDYAFRERCPHSRNYFSGNWMDDVLPADPWSLVIWYNLDAGEIATIKQSEPFDVEPVTTHSADEAYTLVLAGAGATLPARDSVATRIVIEVQSGTGGIIDDEQEVGGWPVLESTTPPTDPDHDGMPDSWETARGLNPSVDDSAGDRDDDGYTNIEEYINGIPWP